MKIFKFKHYIARVREYIFIILTATIFSIIVISKSFSNENIFIVDNIKVQGPIDLNFSREKYIDQAFLKSFETLLPRVVLSEDLNKINKTRLKKIKSLINSFKIMEETYRNDEYKASFKIFYNEIKVKKLLVQKNISFSQTKKISAIFFPVLFINEEIQDFYDNFFYKNWNQSKIENELINFILPLEDLDDISKIKKMKNRIEELNVDDFVNKYNIKNYVFTLMNHQNEKLNVYVRANFSKITVSKNFSYELKDINNKSKLDLILKDLKIKVTDIWKEENVINIAIPLTLRVKFKYKNLDDLYKIKKVFYKINIIDRHSLDEFNINNSFFKLYYYGNPKRLKTELMRFGYKLENYQGHWEIYIDD